MTIILYFLVEKLKEFGTDKNKIMIIGISGKKQSGKDTIGNIIQTLTSKANTNGIGVEWSDWKVKKFADKLKDITCLLIGCTREQLEDESFKNKELGEEWNRTVWHIQSNHNRLETYNSKQEAEADLSHYDENYNQEVYIASEDIIMTPRLMLQLLGTECGRNIIHPEIWVNSLVSDYKMSELGKAKLRRANNATASAFALKGGYYPNWLVTDVRFPNEAEAIKRKGGLLIRVESKRCNYDDIHPSETSLDNYGGVGNEVRTDRWDKVIFNDGSIEDLKKEVKKFLIKKGIIYETK